MDQKLIDVAGAIRRYPSLNANWFPSLPHGADFILAAPIDGHWKIEVDGKIYTYADYKKARKAINNKGVK